MKCSPKLGKLMLKFSRVRLLPAGGAAEPFNSDIGALLPRALCGRTLLQFLRQPSIFYPASSRLRNQWVLRRFLDLPLKNCCCP
jgi:hypothetical protein